MDSSPAQTLAIRHASGPIQVLAGPGSGKTYLTIRRIRHLICHHGVSPEKILVITFTKAAAAEMKERFDLLTQGQYPGVRFGTFHAVYYQMLRQSYRLVRQSCQTVSQSCQTASQSCQTVSQSCQTEKQSCHDGGRLTLATAQEKRNCLTHILKMHGIQNADMELVGTLLKEISRQKNAVPFGSGKETDTSTKCGNEDSIRNGGKGQRKHATMPGKQNPAGEEDAEEQKLRQLFPTIFREYGELMEETGKLDFDDMIYLCGRMLTEQEDVRIRWQRAFSHILVDEFQDISPLQYQILKLLAEPERNLFVVGDDDQSIYGFRGAGPDIMRQFMRDYPQARQLTLETNYRSAQSIVTISLRLVSANRNRFPKQIRAHQETEGCAAIHAFSVREEEERYLADTMKKMTAEELSHTAVICRTNAQLAGISRLFAKEGISFSSKERVENLFSHDIAKDFLAYLQFAAAGAHPPCGNRKDFLRIMNKPCRYIQRCALDGGDCSEQALTAFYRQKPYMQEILRRFFTDLKRLSALRPYLAIHHIRKAMGYDKYLCENKRIKEREKLLETADEIQRTASGCRSLEEWLCYMEHYTECLEEGHTPAPNARHTKPAENPKNPKDQKNRENGVTLITMHGSKGLEYDTVFLPQISARQIPSRQAHTPEETEEERRILYVAMTRAKQRLEISYAGKPSPFLTSLQNENGTVNPMPT